MRRGGRRRRRSRMGGRLPARRRPSSRLPCARARQCLDDRTLATRAESRSGSPYRVEVGQLPDVYATITEAEPAVVEGLVDILELRAADPQQREMREAYFADIGFPAGARVAEVGCGPGPVARALASQPGVGTVVGVDPSPIFIAKGRELARNSRISGSSRATRVRSRWRTDRSTWSCSTPPSAMSPVPNSP